MSSVGLAQPARLFHGWWVVLGAFGVMLMGFGGAYTFSVFIEPLQQAFGASRGQAALVFSVAGALNFGLGVLSGPLADRWGARSVAMVGMAVAGAGMVLAGLAQSLTQVYLAYGLGVGIGVGMAYVPAVGAVQRWFLRQRGFASGLAVSGIGVGTLLLPPLAQWLLNRQGWRGAYLVLGALVFVLGIAAAALLENDPRARGLAPDGDAPPPDAKGAGTRPAPGLRLGEAVRTRSFRLMYMAALCTAFAVFVPFVHLVPYAMDHGVPKSSAVLLLGAIGVGSTLGRFALGWVMDRWGRSRALVAMHAALALVFAGWLLADGFAALVLFALCYGTVYGGWVAVLPAVVMDQFGGRQVSSIIGTLYTAAALGTLIGPSLTGLAFDLQHSYVVPIAVGVVLNVVAALILLRLPAPNWDKA